jgi:hypothetical protein
MECIKVLVGTFLCNMDGIKHCLSNLLYRAVSTFPNFMGQDLQGIVLLLSWLGEQAA